MSSNIINHVQNEFFNQNSIYEALPIPSSLWGESCQLVDCNTAFVRFSGFKTKEETFSRFFELVPNVQPDGTPSEEKIKMLIRKVFDTNAIVHSKFVQILNGIDVPVDITLAKVTIDGQYYVICFGVNVMSIDVAERDARVLLDSMPLMIEIWDEELNLIEVNRQVMELFNRMDKKDYVQHFAETLPAFQPCGTPSMEKSDALIAAAFKDGYAYCEKWIHIDAKGNQIPFEATFVRVNRGGKKVVIVYSHNISGIQASMEREKEALNLANKILESMPVAIDLWDDELNLINTNPFAVKLFNLSSKEEYIHEFMNLSPPLQPNGLPSKETALFNVKKVFTTGHEQFEWMRQKQNGELLPTEVTLIKSSHMGRDVVIAFSTDLRPMKAAIEYELKQEQQRHQDELDARIRLMFDKAPIMIEYWDKNYNAIDCNQTTLDVYGFATMEDFIMDTDTNADVTLTEVQPNGKPSLKERHKHLDNIFSKGHDHFEFIEKKLDGTEIYLEVEGIRIKQGDEYVAVTYSRDITQLRQLQAEQQRMEVIEESNRAKTRFLARMSHEIRTPLSAIIGIAEIQLQRGTLSPIVEESFAKVHDSAGVLLDIVNDILDLSKIESGKMNLLCKEYNISSLVSDAIQPHLINLGQKDIEFVVNIDPNLPVQLIGDSIRVKQVINNLLSNAFKYTNTGMVKLNMSCRPLMQDKLCLEIHICDTGMGMNKQQLSSVFQDYTRFHEHSHVTGTGLGMSIVYNLLELMGATISIDSQVNKGTCVLVCIPQKIGTPEVIGKKAASRLQRFETSLTSAEKRFNFVPEPMPYGRVLVVDDVDANLYVARGLLTFYDLQIETCTSGHTAVDRIRKGMTYDVVFMDQMMPGMDGTEAMQTMRRLGYTGTIVALTANALIGQAEELITSGFDGFISKPIQTAHLDRILTKYIRDKQSSETLEAAARSRSAEDNRRRSEGISGYQSDPELVDKLKADFVRRHRITSNVIKQFWAEGNTKSMHILVHSLKGTAGLIGETLLLQKAQDVETTIVQGEIPTALQIDELLEVLAGVLSKIAGNELINDMGNKVLDKEKAADIMNRLEPLLKNRNNECVEMIKELQTLPETAILVRQIEEYDFALALKNLTTLRSILLG
ncbi:MAG: response regulator [Defluviitaleaceae bacterium]|nr:response regulator [Defluviitaleaceae bacterium]